MTSRTYNTKHNSLVGNENSTPETSKFDNLDKEMLNLKDVIIKDLLVENQRLCNKINNLEKKVISLEENSNS